MKQSFSSSWSAIDHLFKMELRRTATGSKEIVLSIK
jgi:hypothetical protein